jgi:two-component system sensor histidine kinase ChiS
VAPEARTAWLSTLQCDDETLEFLDTGALLGRRKIARAAEAPAAVEEILEPEATALFVTRDSQEEQEPVTTRTVLVVNSSEVEGAALSRILKESSFNTITTRTGAEALEFLRTESIDLMVCDLRLPEMNAQQISEHRNRTGNHAEIPVLLVLSHAGDQSHLVTQQLGAVDHVRSPVKQDEFVMVVKRLMEVS